MSLCLLGSTIDGCYFWNRIKYLHLSIFLLSRTLFLRIGKSQLGPRELQWETHRLRHRFMRRYHCIDRWGKPRQVRVNWIMSRLRRFARHSCISYWQRIITASGQFAARSKSLPLHFRENLYRKYAEEGTTSRLSSPALPLAFPRPNGNWNNRAQLGNVPISRM